MAGSPSNSSRGTGVRSRGAIIRDPAPGAPFVIEEFELDPPAAGEVLVRMAAAGLCHTDRAVADGSLPLSFRPLVCGHEGAGVVEEIGAGVTGLRVGDHVVLAPPACGVCRWCTSGRASQCELAQRTFSGPNVADGRYRRHIDGGTPLGAFVQLGTFADLVVANEASCVRIPDHVPLGRAALLGCGVVTGWGAAVYTAGTRPGDTIVVVGVGGVGACAVQGARMAGAAHIVAVDTSPWKRERAPLFGATHVAAGFDEAAAVVAELTGGRGAERAVLTVGMSSSTILQQTVGLTGPRGVTATAVMADAGVQNHALDLMALTGLEKEIRGSLLGGCSMHYDIPRLLEYAETGQLLLDPLITGTIALEQINEGYQAVHAGEQFRTQIRFG